MKAVVIGFVTALLLTHATNAWAGGDCFQTDIFGNCLAFRLAPAESSLRLSGRQLKDDESDSRELASIIENAPTAPLVHSPILFWNQPSELNYINRGPR